MFLRRSMRLKILWRETRKLPGGKEKRRKGEKDKNPKPFFVFLSPFALFPFLPCCYGRNGGVSNPMVSGKPIIRLKFCTAWPAAPLVRLSMAEMTMTRRPPPATRRARSQKFAPARPGYRGDCRRDGGAQRDGPDRISGKVPGGPLRTGAPSGGRKACPGCPGSWAPDGE